MTAEIRDNGQLDWSHFLAVEEGNDVTFLPQIADWIDTPPNGSGMA
jgi:hypothetical protein